MKSNRVILFILFLLIGVTAYSVYEYIITTREKLDLLQELDQVNLQAAGLEKEKLSLLDNLDKEKEIQKQLIQDKAELDDLVRAKEDKIAKLNTNLYRAHSAIEKLNSEIAILEEKSVILQGAKEKLEFDLIRVSQEKDQFKARLSSIPELKKAIREVKIQMRKDRIQLKEKLGQQRRMSGSTKTVTAGNGGFLIRDGASCVSQKVTIEVIPVVDSARE